MLSYQLILISNTYLFSAYSFRRNYSFLNLALFTVSFDLFFINLNSCCGNYSREKTIQGLKLFAEIRYPKWIFPLGDFFHNPYYLCNIMWFVKTMHILHLLLIASALSLRHQLINESWEVKVNHVFFFKSRTLLHTLMCLFSLSN